MTEKSSMRFALAAIGLAAVCASPTAHADGYVWDPVSKSFTATATYNGSSASISSTHSATVASALRVVTNSTGTLFLNLQSALYQKIGAEARLVPEYRSHVSSISGPLDITLTHSPGSGLASVQLTGISATATVQFEGAKYGITYRCRVTVSSGALTFGDGVLDLVSGSLANLMLKSANPSHSESCSTSLGWIPFIGSLADKFATRYASSYIQEALASIAAAPNLTLSTFTFAGLDQALPALPPMVANNVDVAAYLRNNLSNFFLDNTVRVYFGQSPLPGNSVSGDIFFISFSKQNVSFKVTEYATYRKRYICPPPQTACTEF